MSTYMEGYADGLAKGLATCDEEKRKMREALTFIREQITALAGHENCRCLICEGIPTECDRILGAAR